MKKSNYERPETRVIELRHSVALLQLSNLGKRSAKNMSSSESFELVEEIDDTYSDN